MGTKPGFICRFCRMLINCRVAAPCFVESRVAGCSEGAASGCRHLQPAGWETAGIADRWTTADAHAERACRSEWHDVCCAFCEVSSGMLLHSFDVHASPHALGETSITQPLPMDDVQRKRKCAGPSSALRSLTRQLGTWSSAASPIQDFWNAKRIRCGLSECMKWKHRDNRN